MKKRVILTTVGLGILVVTASLMISYSSDTFAADSSASGQALEIAPPVITLTGDPGQVIKTQINIRDISNDELVVKNQINDFVAGDEDGTPKILLDDGETSPYSLKNWVSKIDELTLKPKQIKNLPVTITVPEDAAPGGYYAIVRWDGRFPISKPWNINITTR
jgi:hypothetical protein